MSACVYVHSVLLLPFIVTADPASQFSMSGAPTYQIYSHISFAKSAMRGIADSPFKTPLKILRRGLVLLRRLQQHLASTEWQGGSGAKPA